MKYINGILRRMRVLFIGNSLTYYAPGDGGAVLHDLPGALERAAPGWRCGRVARHGASLEEHRHDARVAQELRPGRWDYVVLQENTERALSHEAATRGDALWFDARIKAAGARTALFSTWAPRDRPEVAARLSGLCGRLAAELGALLVPVGDAWRRAAAARPGLALYLEDGFHPAPLGSYLSACVFTRSLSGTLAELPGDEERAFLRQVARQAA